MTIIPASGRLRQEYFKFEANLHSIVRYHLKKKKQQLKKKEEEKKVKGRRR
jgi:hypothetical protein